MNVERGTEPKISREKVVEKMMSSKFPSLWASFPLLRKLFPIGVSLLVNAIELSLLYGKIFLWGIGVRKPSLFVTF